MEERYNLTEAAKRLKIDPKTLRRWATISQLPLSKDEEGDGRCRFLTVSQLENLASAHHRTLLTTNKPPGKTNVVQQPEAQKQEMNRLFSEVEGTQLDINTLQQKLWQVEKSVNTLSSSMKKVNSSLKEIQQRIFELEIFIQPPGNEA